MSRKIAILKKKKETGILDAFRKSAEFRHGIYQTVKRNFSRQRGKEAKSRYSILRRTVTAALSHPPFFLNRIGLTRINSYEVEKGTIN